MNQSKVKAVPAPLRGHSIIAAVIKGVIYGKAEDRAFRQ